MMKTFTQSLKSFLVSALMFVVSFPLFLVAANISWSITDKIAELILVKQKFGASSDLLYGSVMVSTFVASILILYKTFSKVPNIFAKSEITAEILKEIAAYVGFIILLGFTYPFTVQVLSTIIDWLFLILLTEH